jgi:hypothetical protein
MFLTILSGFSHYDACPAALRAVHTHPIRQHIHARDEVAMILPQTIGLPRPSWPSAELKWESGDRSWATWGLVHFQARNRILLTNGCPKNGPTPLPAGPVIAVMLLHQCEKCSSVIITRRRYGLAGRSARHPPRICKVYFTGDLYPLWRSDRGPPRLPSHGVLK